MDDELAYEMFDSLYLEILDLKERLTSMEAHIREMRDTAPSGYAMEARRRHDLSIQAQSRQAAQEDLLLLGALRF